VWIEDAFSVKIAALVAALVVIDLSELSGELLASGFVDRIGKHRLVGGGFVLNSLAALRAVRI